MKIHPSCWLYYGAWTGRPSGCNLSVGSVVLHRGLTVCVIHLLFCLSCLISSCVRSVPFLCFLYVFGCWMFSYVLVWVCVREIRKRMICLINCFKFCSCVCQYVLFTGFSVSVVSVWLKVNTGLSGSLLITCIYLPQEHTSPGISTAMLPPADTFTWALPRYPSQLSSL